MRQCPLKKAVLSLPANIYNRHDKIVQGSAEKPALPDITASPAADVYVSFANRTSKPYVLMVFCTLQTKHFQMIPTLLGVPPESRRQHHLVGHHPPLRLRYGDADVYVLQRIGGTDMRVFHILILGLGVGFHMLPFSIDIPNTPPSNKHTSATTKGLLATMFLYCYGICIQKHVSFGFLHMSWMWAFTCHQYRDTSTDTHRATSIHRPPPICVGAGGDCMILENFERVGAVTSGAHTPGLALPEDRRTGSHRHLWAQPNAHAGAHSRTQSKGLGDLTTTA